MNLPDSLNPTIWRFHWSPFRYGAICRFAFAGTTTKPNWLQLMYIRYNVRRVLHNIERTPTLLDALRRRRD